MTEINTQQLLSQMRALQAEIGPIGGQPQPLNNEPNAGFGTLFKDAINQVSETQATATQMKRDFETGVGDKSLAEVMIASQKANLSFRAMTEVRNKLVTAYQEIMNMPV